MGLDTGAQTVVTPDVAARLHLPRDWRRKTRALGTTAVFIANNAIIRDLEFSGAHYEWKSVAAVSLIDKIPFGSFTMKFDLGGLLGADILSNYDLEFDFFERTLTLYSVRGCVAMTPPWTGDFTATPFQVTPQRRIVLPVEVDGKKLTAIFDTGAYETFLSPAAAAKLGLSGKELKTEQSKTVIGVGNISANLPTHQFGSLSAGGLTLSNRRFGILKVALIEGDILLGQDFMTPHRFWASYATRTLFVQRWQPGTTGKSALSKEAPNRQGQLPSTAAVSKPPALKLRDASFECPISGVRSDEIMDVSDAASFAGLAQEAGYFGAGVRNLAAESVKALSLAVENAVLVTHVIPEAPAGRAGVRPGDVIVSLDGKIVLTKEAFMRAIRSKKPTGIIQLEILRRGERRTITATLGEAPKPIGKGYSIELAMAAEEAIAEIFPREKFPVEWAVARANFGRYVSLSSKRDADTIEKAIEAYEAALSVLELRSRERIWSGVQERLGNAYFQRKAGDAAANIERAIKAYEAVLSGPAGKTFDEPWAELQCRLGAAYQKRIQGESRDNLIRAAAAYGAAALIWTKEAFPEKYSLMECLRGQVVAALSSTGAVPAIMPEACGSCCAGTNPAITT
ncbi:MAG TPA: aspartyl protease family protein, partial [Hyphomicrobiales bacterium]|nr:aspartyl protease family protein [Hyphomicrobiales bacterium]